MILTYPITLYACSIVLLCLVLEAALDIRRSWAIPSICVYLTTLGWYFVDPFQSPEDYVSIARPTLSLSYFQVGLFLLAFRLSVTKLTDLFSPRLCVKPHHNREPVPKVLFFWLACIWLPLVGFGIFRLNGDVIGALIPLDARNGVQMWSRDAVGGSTDSLVSAASYIYQLVCGLLGVTLVLQRNSVARALNAAMYCTSIPYFLLAGSRSIFVAVIAPLFLTYLLRGRQELWNRLLRVGLCLVAIHFLLLMVIENRNYGFHFLLDSQAKAEKATRDAVTGGGSERKRKQEGLNMIQELCYINEFSNDDVFEVAYGKRYLIEFTNMVPRVLWPNKPMIGVDYAIWRGFAGGDSGIGVVATISTGMIGGGVMNFGKWFGPPFAGILLAAWAALLSRWWLQRKSILRFCLFIAGLGLTFNLGRDITLLVLWPIVFAYLLVRLGEYGLGRNRMANGGRSRRKSLKSLRLNPEVSQQRDD